MNATEITSKYKGYCNTCQYSIFKGERIKYNGLAHHLDCQKALGDKYPRRLNPSYKKLVGKVNKQKMLKMMKDRKGLASQA